MQEMKTSQMILYSKNNSILMTLHQSMTRRKDITLHGGGVQAFYQSPGHTAILQQIARSQWSATY